MRKKLNQIKAVIFDVDGVFYDPRSVPDMEPIFRNTIALTASSLSSGLLSYKDAYAIATESYRIHGYSTEGFNKWAVQNGHNAELLRLEIFKTYHPLVLDKVRQRYPEVLSPDPKKITSFRSSAQIGIVHGVVTHGCIDGWVTPLFSGQGILPFFNQAAMLGLDQYDFTPKHEATNGIQKCATILGVDLSDSAFVEDTLRNLETAKNNHPELTTVYIHHGSPLRVLPSYVDYQFDTVADFKRALVASHRFDRRVMALPQIKSPAA